MAWLGIRNPPEVIPLHDLKEHVYGEACWCFPVYEEDVLVHNPMDGREKIESGESKPH